MPNRFFDAPGVDACELSPEELRALGLPAEPARWLSLSALRFRSDLAGGVIVVPAGFVSDEATIPPILWSVFMAPDDPVIEMGAWVHDLLCQGRGTLTLEDGRTVHLSSWQSAAVLAHEAMPDLGASALQCASVYEAVGHFGPQWA